MVYNYNTAGSLWKHITGFREGHTFLGARIHEELLKHNLLNVYDNNYQ
jgi:hypothetical protein